MDGCGRGALCVAAFNNDDSNSSNMIDFVAIVEKLVEGGVEHVDVDVRIS